MSNVAANAATATITMAPISMYKSELDLGGTCEDTVVLLTKFRVIVNECPLTVNDVSVEFKV